MIGLALILAAFLIIIDNKFSWRDFVIIYVASEVFLLVVMFADQVCRKRDFSLIRFFFLIAHACLTAAWLSAVYFLTRGRI